MSAAASSPFPLIGASLSDDARVPDIPAGQSLESHLKRQSLETLVAVLRSLVSWAGRGTLPPPSTTAIMAVADSSTSLEAIRQSEDGAGTSETDLNAPVGRANGGNSGSATPDVVPSDDPTRFENAKQRKTTLLEGIKKFNFKPKRVSSF